MESNINKYSILNFSFIPDNNYKLEDFFSSINFGVVEANIHNLKKNIIKIPFNRKENLIYYNETISFYSKNNINEILISTDYPIYINKINNIYIYYNGNNKDKIKSGINISAELIFQIHPDCFFTLKHIKLDDLNLKLFDYYKNFYRKRIGIFNFNPNSLELLNQIKRTNENFQFEDGESYKIIIRYYEKDNPEISIANFRIIDDGIKKISPIFIIDKIKINNKLKNFINFFHIFIQDIRKNKKISEKEKKIINNDFKYDCDLANNYYDNILNYEEFEEIDKSIFHYLFYYNLLSLILDIFEKDEDKCLFKLTNINEFISFYEKKIDSVINYKCNIRDSLLLIKTYNFHFLNYFKTGIEIDNISFINVNEIEKDNPYYQAINFLKNIIMNLEEISLLFELLLSFDCEVISNLLEENKEIKAIEYTDIYGDVRNIIYEKNPTEYGMNLLNIQEIKEHLLQLMPRFIVRLNTDLRFRADYLNKGNIMTINEKILFKKKSDYLDISFKREYNYIYIIPIVMEILHELYAHAKLRFINNDSHSAQEMRISKYNFKPVKILKKVKINNNVQEINFPESGIALENSISDDKNVIKWLKSVCIDKQKVQKLLNVSLWVDKNFNKLESLVKQYIELEKKNNNIIYNDKYESSNDDSIDDLDLYDCGFSS